MFCLRHADLFQIRREVYPYCFFEKEGKVTLGDVEQDVYQRQDLYTLYTISLKSSMMYIRQVQILVQAQICTWLIVYTKKKAAHYISSVQLSFLCALSLFL